MEVSRKRAAKQSEAILTRNVTRRRLFASLHDQGTDIFYLAPDTML